MQTLETFSRSYRATIDHLYEVSACARFSISESEFAAALYRSCEQHLRSSPRRVEMQRFLESLHVADLALALACRTGNEDAWRQFHETYRPTVERYARAMVHDLAAAKELADTLWGDLYGLGRASPLDHYHGSGALEPWLGAVMRRRRADLWRRASRLERLGKEADFADASRDDATTRPPDPEREHYLGILADVLGRVLDQLDARDQLRLSHYYVQGLPLAKVGALMGDHESTVSRGLLRTRREIRREVERRLRREHRLSDDQIRRCIEYATEDWPLDLAGAFIGEVRRNGLDLTLAINCSGSMSLIVGDIKARIRELVDAVHQLVPIARIGLVVFGGKHLPLQVQPLTQRPLEVAAFLDGMIPRPGGEWEEDTLGACRHAVTSMDWRDPARKAIVLVGDSPPPKQDWAPLLALICEFRSRNGIFNTIDVAEEEHERFEREFWRKQHGGEPPAISPLPAFYRQAHTAYKALADAGGGAMRSLTKDCQINYEVLVLAFGEQWRNQVAAYGRAIMDARGSHQQTAAPPARRRDKP